MDSNHHIEIQSLAACQLTEPGIVHGGWGASRRSRRTSEPQRGIEPLFPAWKAGASGHSATGAFHPAYVSLISTSCWFRVFVTSIPRRESNSALRVKSPLHHASMLTGSTCTVRLGGVEPPCSRISGGRLDRLSYRRVSGGAGSNRLLGSHNPALCLVSYAPVPVGLPVGFDPTPSRLRGGCSAI